MKLFSYKGYKFTFSEEAYQLKPFKRIIDRDKSPEKEIALAELSFIYFYCDPRSDYMIYADKEERIKQIKIGQDMNEAWMPDGVVLDAIEFYESFVPLSVTVLKSARKMAASLQALVDELNLNDRDENGRLKLKAKEVKDWLDVAKQIPEVVKSLDEAEKTVAKDIAEQQARVKGGYELTVLDEELGI